MTLRGLTLTFCTVSQTVKYKNAAADVDTSGTLLILHHPYSVFIFSGAKESSEMCSEYITIDGFVQCLCK